jgi:uncharacterized protein YggT (Ycf19 family)
MRHFKSLRLPAIALAALMMLSAAGSGPALAQLPAPATQPNIATVAPSATAVTPEDIRDIRPPIHIPYGWLWAAYVVGGLVLAGVLFAAWRWYRRRDHSRRKLLYELTLDQLEAVRALMEPLKGYQFSIAVSEIVRNYIEQRFQVRAAHRTTQEFLHDLLAESHAALTAHHPLLAEFLEHCDLAKFARWQLSVAQMEAMYQSARTFVIETGTPVVNPPAVTPAVRPLAESATAESEPEPVLIESSST